MIRMYTHKGIQIQQWFNKYSFRVDNGQWYEYPSLEQAQTCIEGLKNDEAIRKLRRRIPAGL